MLLFCAVGRDNIFSKMRYSPSTNDLSFLIVLLFDSLKSPLHAKFSREVPSYFFLCVVIIFLF